ncbi:hypothetical protein [Rhizocola hellebori]|nr:hypothetical protein [Rhizocola hellebori]
MPANVLHQPRVAFDAARTLVDVCAADDIFAWYGDQLAAVLGPSYQRDLLATRTELTRSQRVDIRNIETGKWRVKLEDVLRTRADIAERLHHLTQSATTRLARE